MRTPEHERLFGADDDARRAWRRFGPYLSERQWGTVREDYSPDGTAWDSFPHDMARSRAYRWGEDGLAGWSDDEQFLCLGLALWNARDPILKERLFGLTGPEGNHGEDVKELYYYLDATPSHAYQRMLYKYPQSAFPYDRLVAGNRTRGRSDPELELIDTGVFDEDRYFDVFVEYAKHEPEDILMRVLVCNRADAEAPITVIPQAWFRNTWSWGRWTDRPTLQAVSRDRVDLSHPVLGAFVLHCDDPHILAVCDNETNHRRVHGVERATGFFKDGLHEYVVRGDERAINPTGQGTKVGAVWRRVVAPHGEVEIRVRLARRETADPFAGFDEILVRRRSEADAFYDALHPAHMSGAERQVQRQALAGLLWSKQFYAFDVRQWLEGDPGQPEPPAARHQGRNRDWVHLNNADILSMPDKWEYPWYAAWDLAFHCVPLAMVDPDFAKTQLLLLTREWYMHPNGALPVHRGGDAERRGRGARPLGRRRWLLLRCAPLRRPRRRPVRVDSPPRPVAGGARAALRGRDAGCRPARATARLPPADGLVPAVSPRPGGARVTMGDARGGQPASPVPAARAPDEAAVAAHAGRDRVPVGVRRAIALEVPPRPPVSARDRRHHAYGQLPARGIGQRHVRGELELARAHLDAGNYLLVDSLRKFHRYYGPDFLVECPTGSGVFLNLAQIADELSARLSRLFLPDTAGRRPCLGLHPKLERDPYFRDHVVFHEYFHGDDGRGVGASHQTGWTAIIATLLAETSPTAAAQAGPGAPSSPGGTDRR